MVSERPVAVVQLAPAQRKLRSLRNGNRHAPVGRADPRCRAQRTPELGPRWAPSRIRINTYGHAPDLVHAGRRNRRPPTNHTGPKRIAQLVAEVNSVTSDW